MLMNYLIAFFEKNLEIFKLMKKHDWEGKPNLSGSEKKWIVIMQQAVSSNWTVASR